MSCDKTSENREILRTADSIIPTGKPHYTNDTEIEICAYAGPRRGGYRYYNGKYGEHPDDPPGGWESFINEENFSEYRDCGFTFLLPEYDADYDWNTAECRNAENFRDSDLYPYMELAESMGIPVVVYAGNIVKMTSRTDGLLSEEEKAYLKRLVEDLSVYKTFKGITLRDEPRTDYLKSFRAVWSYLLTLKPDLYFFTCMLPIYGSPSITFTASDDEEMKQVYREYINEAVEATGCFIYDFYPLWIDPVTGRFHMPKTWYENFEMVAQSARKEHLRTGITLQTVAIGRPDSEFTLNRRRRIESRAEISYQVYTALAYGIKSINYFTYWQHWGESDGECFYNSGMVLYPEKTGGKPVKTKAYYAVKEVNEEIKKFDHVFLRFNWVGTTAVAADGCEKSENLSAISSYKSPRIETVSASGEMIIGCLRDKNGYDGFMIVNSTDPSCKCSIETQVCFRDADSVIAYIHGEEREIGLENGRLALTLEAGEGTFVIPIKY